MITEPGKFFSVPCERPQRWSPPLLKRQLPQTKLWALHTQDYIMMCLLEVFRLKHFSAITEVNNIIQLTKMGLSVKVFSIQNNNNNKPYWLQQWGHDWLFQWQISDMTDSSNHFSPGYAIERIPKSQYFVVNVSLKEASALQKFTLPS